MSQFADIFKAVKTDVAETNNKTEPVKSRIKRVQAATSAGAKTIAAKQPPAESAAAVRRAETTVKIAAPPGRRSGKSSDPDFTQVLTYIKKATHKDVRKALLDDEEGDLSDLVENLLSVWLENRK